MRELIWMADAKRKELWEHTSATMALMANVNKTKDTKAFKPSDFNPYAQQQEVFKTDDLSILEKVGFKRIG